MTTKYVHCWDSLTHGISVAVFRDGVYVRHLVVDPNKAKALGIKLIKGKERTKFLRENGYRLNPDTRRIVRRKV